MTIAEAAAEKYADGTLTFGGLNLLLDHFFARGMADEEMRPDHVIFWSSFNRIAEAVALRSPTAPPRTVSAWLTSSRSSATTSTAGPTS